MSLCQYKYNKYTLRCILLQGGEYQHNCAMFNFIHQMGYGTCWFDSTLNIIFDSPDINKLIMESLIGVKDLYVITNDDENYKYNKLIMKIKTVFYEMNNLVHILRIPEKTKHGMMMKYKRLLMDLVNMYRYRYIYQNKIPYLEPFVTLTGLRNHIAILPDVYNRKFTLDNGNYPDVFIKILLCICQLKYSSYEQTNIVVSEPTTYHPFNVSVSNPHVILIKYDVSATLTKMPVEYLMSKTNKEFFLAGVLFICRKKIVHTHAGHGFSACRCRNGWYLYENNHIIAYKGTKRGILYFSDYEKLKNEIINLDLDFDDMNFYYQDITSVDCIYLSIGARNIKQQGYPVCNSFDNIDLSESLDFIETHVDPINNAEFNARIYKIHEKLLHMTSDMKPIPPRDTFIYAFPIATSEDTSKKIIQKILTEYIFGELDKKTLHVYVHIINYVLTKLLDRLVKIINKQYPNLNIQLKLVYKGGNIMLFYKNILFKNLPHKAVKMLEDFESSFTQSDLDFTILYNFSNSYQILPPEIIHKLECVIYSGLLICRTIILSQKSLLPVCNKNEEYLRRDMQIILHKLISQRDNYISPFNNIDLVGLIFNSHYVSINEAENIHYIPNDQIIAYHNDVTGNSFVANSGVKMINFKENLKLVRSDTTTIKKNNNNEIHRIEPDCNTVLMTLPPTIDTNCRKLTKEYGNNGVYITRNVIGSDQKEFKLHRMMVNFGIVIKSQNSYGVVDVGAELYDVAISNVNDPIKQIWTNDNLHKYKYVFNGEQKEIDIPNINILYGDLLYMLFGMTVYENDFSLNIGNPWDMQKYEKRMIRLMLIMYIKLLSTDPVLECIHYLISIKDTIRGISDGTTKISTKHTYNVKHDNFFETFIIFNSRLHTKIMYHDVNPQMDKYSDYIKKTVIHFS